MKKIRACFKTIICVFCITGCTAITDFDKDNIETTKMESFVVQYDSDMQLAGFDILFVVDLSQQMTQDSTEIQPPADLGWGDMVWGGVTTGGIYVDG